MSELKEPKIGISGKGLKRQRNIIDRQNISQFNPLPLMPILGSSSSAANKNIMSQILTNGDTSF